jgi:hypothetical protein
MHHIRKLSDDWNVASSWVRPGSWDVKLGMLMQSVKRVFGFSGVVALQDMWVLY